MRGSARVVARRASIAEARWRRREVAASAVIAVCSAFIVYLAWTQPMSFAERLLDTGVALGGFAGARMPRLLFLPTALRDARGAGLVIPLSALRLAQCGRWLLLAAFACWLGASVMPA
jgi:hypothetical protein